MLIKLENQWLFLLLLVLAIVTSWQVYELMNTSEKTNHHQRHFPDSIGYRLVLKRFDTTGFLTSIISSDQAVHYPDTQITDFKTIHMQLFSHQPNIPPWLINAPTGKAYNRGERFELNGQVLMNQVAYQTHPATQVITSELVILPNEKLVTTDQAIQLLQPGLLLNAMGARYNYDQQVLNLLQQVRVNYQPQKKLAPKNN